MPNSFFNTQGYDSPVFPAIQFASPQYFGQTYPNIIKGVQSGYNLGEQIGDTQQKNIMEPLQVKNAQQQLALNNLQQEKIQRELLQPNLVPVDEQVVNENREEPLDQKGYDLAISEGYTPEQAHKLATTPLKPKVDQYKLSTFRDLNTGQTVQHKTLHKSAEDIDKEMQMAAMYGLTGKARETTAAAATTRATASEERAQLGTQRTGVGTDEQGNYYNYDKVINPQTHQVEWVKGEPAKDAQIKAELIIARTKQANAAANRPSANVSNETWDFRQDKIAARLLNMDVDIYRELKSTPEGSAALDAREAELAGARKQGEKPVVDPAEQAAIDKARQAVADKKHTNPTVITGPIPNPEPQAGEHRTDPKTHKGATYMGNGRWTLDD